jgi:hypothetical protein
VGGSYCKESSVGPWPGGIKDELAFVQGAFYKLKGQSAGIIWMPFVGWGRVIDWIDTFHALKLALRYFNYMYEVQLKFMF